MKHINYSKKIGTFIVSLALTTMLATSIWAAGYSIKGNLSVNVHIVPILKDNATAYTSVSRPSKKYNDCESKTTVKIYNSDGDCKKDSYNLKGGTVWDLPLNAGAKASIRAAKKAVGTHKAKTYNTNNKWVSTKNTIWKK